jgi:hypothetical protein
MLWRPCAVTPEEPIPAVEVELHEAAMGLKRYT